MLVSSFYYDEIAQENKTTNLWEMKALEKSNNIEFKRRQKKLFRKEDGRIPMVLVRNGAHQGFKRKGLGTGNRTNYSRGDSESLTHQGNKEAIATLEELTIRFGDEQVELFIESIETEKEVACNGTEYEVDIYFKLRSTNPIEYCEKWGGELWFEVFHTCKVDCKKAEDFALENRTLFEYKVPEFFEFVDYISAEGYEKRKKYIATTYLRQGISGILICQNRGKSLSAWRKSDNGNWTARIGNNSFTIIKSKYDDTFGIVYGNKKYKWDYNGNKFSTIDEAIKVADYFAFMLFNGEKI